MKEKYLFNRWGGKPEKVIVERETDSSVWVNGKRRQKDSSYERYFETIEEGKHWLIALADAAIEDAKSRVLYYEKEKARLYLSFEKWESK